MTAHGVRVAVVSGANRGIGREIARQLVADHGMTVLLGARDLAAGDVAAAEIGDGAQARQLDVTDQASVDALIEGAEGDFGRLDVVVNNAGIVLDGGEPSAEADVEKIRATLEVNVLGAWRLIVAALPLLRRSDSARIVNVSSGMGQLSDMGATSAGYRTSKAALNAMTRNLAAELGNDVKINSACPGWVRTDMGGSGASRDVEHGAQTPVWLATLPDDGPSGGFFRDREPIPW